MSVFGIIGGTVILVISGLGLIVYAVVIITIFTQKRFAHSSFFRIAGTLGVADCICLILMIGYAAPCILLQRDISNKLLFGGILNIGWFSGLPLVALLAGDRYLCICRGDIFKQYYSMRKTKLYCILSWVFGTAYSIASFFPCCGIFFEWEIASWQWNVQHTGSLVLSYGEITMVIFLTSFTFFLNGLVLRHLKDVRKVSSLDNISSQRKNIREKKIFIQFLITTIWLLIFDIPFVTLGYLDNPSVWLGYFVTVAYVINCSINGWVYLIMNRLVRNEVLKIVFKRKSTRRRRVTTIDRDDGNFDRTRKITMEA